MSQEIEFISPLAYRKRMALSSGIGVLLGLGILKILGMGVGISGPAILGATIGAGIALYFFYPVYTVNSTGLLYKYSRMKGNAFPFADFSFTIEKRTGIKSLFISLLPQVYVLVPHSLAQKPLRTRTIIISLSDDKVKELLKAMEDRGARIEGEWPA